MITSVAAVLVALSIEVGTARSDVVVDTQELRGDALFTALSRAKRRGVKIDVALGAKADFVLDERGNPRGGNRPYDTGPQGRELAVLDAMGARVFIPPQFSELDRPVFDPGVEFNPAFAVVDGKWSAVCSGPLVPNKHAVCWSSTNTKMAQSLLAIHAADTKDSPPQTAGSERTELASLAAKADLVLTPENNQDFLLLLRQAWAQVYASHLGHGPALDALRQQSPGHLWLSQKGDYARGAVESLRSAGWSVSYAQTPFVGTVLLSPKAAFIGSQKLDALHLEKSRGLGVVLAPEHAKAIADTLNGNTDAKHTAPTIR